MLHALIQVLLMLLWLLGLIIVVQAILSWLVAFNVINTYNDFVRTLLYALDRITAPIYRPIRKILPDFGGLDFSPLVALVVIWALQTFLGDISTQMLIASY
jgi:YggT family protein